MRFVSTALVMMAMALMLLALTYLTTTSGPWCWRAGGLTCNRVGRPRGVRWKCSTRLSNQTGLRTKRRRKVATARHCRRGPARAYPAIRDGWPAGARKSKAASRCRRLRPAIAEQSRFMSTRA